MVDMFKWLFGGNAPAQGDPVQDPDAPHIPPGFPVALLPYHKQIEATRQSILGAQLLRGIPQSATSSQLGGHPWWPKSLSYPTDAYGKPLMMLIQINFDDMPVLENFPTEGLLQFFIGTDDNYGCNFENPTAGHGFACVYHADTTQEPRTDFSEISDAAVTTGDFSPLKEPFTPIELSFSQSTMLLDTTDYRFTKLLPQVAEDTDLVEQYDTLLADVPRIRLGGYPTFTQQDPRSHIEEWIGDISLLTVDTTRGVMWGDSGAGQFFITREDLLKRDFSKVAYSWDCC